MADDNKRNALFSKLFSKDKKQEEPVAEADETARLDEIMTDEDEKSTPAEQNVPADNEDDDYEAWLAEAMTEESNTSDEDISDALAELLQPLMAQYADVSMQRAGRYMRLADSRLHKGSALAHVAEAWQLAEDRLLIIGDGHNDMDAFSRFPGAFNAAPSDAHPEVLAWLREHGGYISPESGVMQILRHWGALSLS